VASVNPPCGRRRFGELGNCSRVTKLMKTRSVKIIDEFHPLMCKRDRTVDDVVTRPRGHRSGRTFPGLIPNRGAALRIASAA